MSFPGVRESERVLFMARRLEVRIALDTRMRLGQPRYLVEAVLLADWPEAEVEGISPFGVVRRRTYLGALLADRRIRQFMAGFRAEVEAAVREAEEQEA